MDTTSRHTKYNVVGQENADDAVFVIPNPEPEGAIVRFFTRLGGVSKPPFDSLNVSVKVGDDRASVAENLSRIRGATDGRPSAWIQQVAGDVVLEATQAGLAGEADALVTRAIDLSLVVAVADCVPVALVGDSKVGLAHSGWRGTLAGVAGKTADMMGGSDVRAYIGPCIRRCCYEVSAEMATDFSGRFGPEVVEGRHLSLPAAISKNLEESGVEEVYDLGLCTGCRTDLFYSHRKEKPVTGRNLVSVSRVA